MEKPQSTLGKTPMGKPPTSSQVGVEVIVEEATTTPMANPGTESGTSAASHSDPPSSHTAASKAFEQEPRDVMYDAVEASSVPAQQKQVQDSSHGRVALKS